MKDDGSLPVEMARLTEVLQEANRLAVALGIVQRAPEREAPQLTPAPHTEPERATRATRPALPDPRLVRRILRNRRLRSTHFDPRLFADPAWDMLLDLAAARAEHRRVSVTSLCIASEVPPTTALRWIGQMVEQGHFVRTGDQSDRRRAFIELSERATDAMARYFKETGQNDNI